MPPEPFDATPDSALGLTNIHHAAGLDDLQRKRVWESTRKAIERHGLELGGELSTGGTSVVFDAREKIAGRHAGRKLVVKVIVEPENAHALACFRREVRLLSSEHVPTDVVPALKFYQDVDNPAAPTVQPFLVAERIDGRPILDYVRHPRPMAMVDRIGLIERCFLALDRLHSCNILQGDVSPNNLLVQQGDVVRLIDLGLAKPLRNVGTRSMSVACGTEGYQPDSVLRGEERLAVWADLHALASVAFQALTDQPKTDNAEANEAALLASGVPSDVARVLRKALRVKDSRHEVDRSLYASAADVVRDLRAARERRARRAARKKLVVAGSILGLIFAVVVAGPVGFLAWRSQTRHWSEIRADQTRKIVALRDQAARLSHDDHPGVKEIADRADRLARDRDEAMARGQTAEADAMTPALIQTLEQSLALRRGLERCLPLRLALGEVLTRVPWIEESDAIAREHRALEDRLKEIGERIQQGETDAAWDALGALHSALGQLARRNVDAARVAEPRARLRRTRTALSASLRDRGAADPDFKRLTSDADAAEQAWTAGDWSSADLLFGLAQQGLNRWLEGKESPEELAARRQADGSSTVEAARREQALRAEVDRLEGDDKALAIQVQNLQAQIARLTDQNLRDRDAHAEASRGLAAAEARLAALSATLTDERAAAATTAKALAAVRSLKDAALNDKATAEAERDRTRQVAEARAKELAAREGELKTAKAELQAWKAHGLPAPPPVVAVAGWQGSRAGDLKIVKVKGQEVRFRWCPPTVKPFKMGDESKPVDVTLTRGFWMLETEVTQGLWQAVMGSKLDWSRWDGPKLPVHKVNHDEARSFGARLTELLVQDGQLPPGWTIKLPTEAQWEYGARAGTATEYPFEGGATELDRYAWHENNSEKRPHEVATREPNGWGLFDMLGNVWEWCADGYEGSIKGGYDPIVMDAAYWVFRGGSWDDAPRDCRPAYRNGDASGFRFSYLGFRVAAVPE